MYKSEYELREAESNRYLANMGVLESEKKRYDLGDEVMLTDEIVFRNNSKRLRICLVKAVSEKIGETTILYLSPTEEEFVPFGRVNFKDPEGKVRGVDWSGGDGWLKIED